MNCDKLDKAAHGRHAKHVTHEEVDLPLRYVDNNEAYSVPPSFTGTELKIEEKPKNRKALKFLGIFAGMLMVLLLIAYGAGVYYFSDHFMDNSSVCDIDVSLLSSAEAQEVLSQSFDDYELLVESGDFALTIVGSDLDLQVNAAESVTQALGQENEWLWPLEMLNEHSSVDVMSASCDEDILSQIVSAAVSAYNEEATSPVDAEISYDSDQDCFVIVPESYGTALDESAVLEACKESISSLNTQLQLSDDELLVAEITSENATLLDGVTAANEMLGVNLTLMLGDDTAATLNSDVVYKWILIDEDGSVSLSEKKMTNWIDELCEACNTVGSTRTYTRDDGKEVEVSGGTYGWEIDYDFLAETVEQAVTEGSTDTVDLETSSTAQAYNGEGEQDWGSRYCDIDLSEQYVRFYDEDGELIWESDCVSGKYNISDTPTGVYTITTKLSPTTLVGYKNGEIDYESYVEYWMPFIGNSIGLHDASWQYAFGGTRYKDGYGSHGCVNLPTSAAGELYSIIQIGDVVVVHW